MNSHSEDMSLQILIYLFGRVPKIASFFHCKFELNKAVTCLREYHLPPPGQLAIPRGLILTRLVTQGQLSLLLTLFLFPVSLLPRQAA